MRRILRFAGRVFLSSLIATRTGAAPVPSHELEANVRDDWRKVRHETERETLFSRLPQEVRQYLPGEMRWQLDLPTSIRLSYAAARPNDFAVLDEYWSAHPEVASNEAVRRAFEETRDWLSGSDGLIERAEQRESIEVAIGDVVLSPLFEQFDANPRSRSSDGDAPGDDDDDDDCGDDDDCYDG